MTHAARERHDGDPGRAQRRSLPRQPARHGPAGHPLPRRQAARCAKLRIYRHSRPREFCAGELARLGSDAFVVLLSAADPADVGEPVVRVTQTLALRNAADARGYAIRFSVGHAAYELRGIIRSPPCSTQPIVTGTRTTSAARPPAREPRRTARRYAPIRDDPRRCNREPRSAQLAQLPHGGALAIASAICSCVRSR